MRKWTKKIVSAMMAVIMTVGMAACGTKAETVNTAGNFDASASGSASVTEAVGGNEGISADSPYANMGFDLSEHEDMVFYVIGEAPTDLEEVLDELNSNYLEPWLNVTLSVEFVPWGVLGDKYPLLLSGGEQVDMIFSASWLDYSSYASQGAFLELTDDLLQKYLVYSYADQPEVSWKQASVANKVYGVCRTLSECNTYNMVVVRQDLLDKAGFTEDIDSFADLEDAMLAIADVTKDDSGFFACGQRNNNELQYLWNQENGMVDLAAGFVYFPEDWSGDLPDSSEIVYGAKTQMWHDFCKEMNRLAQAGCWSDNVINDSSDRQLLFSSGRTGVLAWNGTIGTAGKDLEDAGLGTYQIYDVSRNAKAIPGSYADGMVSIPISAPDPERSLLVIDCLKANKECTMLLCGGIEGRHYIIDEDGYRISGPEADDYPWCSWNWCIQRNDLPEVKNDDARLMYFDETTSQKIYNPKTAAFVFDSTPVADELSVLDATVSEYNSSFMLGMYGDDFEEKYEEYMEALDNAYLDVIQAEVIRQYEEYCKSFE